MADGIPFTPAAPLQQQNPLQTISALENLSLKQQAMEQQAINMRAKQAVGRHMQSALNPETGALDKNQFIKTLATDPEAATEFMPVMQMLVQNGEIEARTAQTQLANIGTQMELTSKSLSPLLDKIQRGQNVSASDWAGAVANMQTNGVFDKREDAQKLLLGAAQNINAQDPQAYNRLVMGIIGRTTAGQELIKQHGLDIERALTPRPTVVGGVRGEVPTYATPFAPPGAANLYGQPAPERQPAPETTAEGTSAPRSAMPVGQMESPSAPSATFLPTEADPKTKQLMSYQTATKDEDHWLRKRVAEDQDDANKAATLETSIHQQVDLLDNFTQGPLMDTRLWTAEKLNGLGFSKGTTDLLLGAKEKGMDALAAAQAAKKGIVEEAANALHTQYPNMSRFTNFDLQMMNKGIATLETNPEAANIIFKHMQNIINIAKERASFSSKYADWSEQNYRNDRSFKRNVLDDSLRDYLKHQGLLRTGPAEIKK